MSLLSPAILRRLAPVLLVALAAPSLADDLPAHVPLRVVPDESSTEQLIYNYLSERSDFDLERVHYDDANSDLGLRLTERMHGVEYHVHVDTDSSGANNSERVIQVRGYVVLKPGIDFAAVHSFINDYQQRYWAPGQLYVDKDGDLAFQTVINIPHTSVSVHPEMVYDALVRLRLGLHNHILPVIASNAWHLN